MMAVSTSCVIKFIYFEFHCPLDWLFEASFFLVHLPCPYILLLMATPRLLKLFRVWLVGTVHRSLFVWYGVPLHQCVSPILISRCVILSDALSILDFYCSRSLPPPFCIVRNFQDLWYWFESVHALICVVTMEHAMKWPR
jgi:hypothetical protein